MESDLRVSSRPIRVALAARIAAAVVVVVFVVVALVMKRYNAGATFSDKDQIATVVVGVLIALGLLMLTRPRLEADATSVRAKSFAGDFRTVPWDVVVAVEFPRNARFARLVLPGDEILALYAVQRVDKDHSVQVMRQLRALHAVARGA
jgi:cytochrome c biogenesis protein CcdA